MKTCPRCGGLGVCRVYSHAPMRLVEDTCPDCDGSGEIEDAEPSPLLNLIATVAFCIAAGILCWLVVMAL